MSTGGETTTATATACEIHCETAGNGSRGGVAWTFYTDIDTDNCKCFNTFSDPTDGQANTNAISGRFVADGDPTDENCRDKCYFWGGTTDDESGSRDECYLMCSEFGWAAGFEIIPTSSICRCVASERYGPVWDADVDTVIYADE